MDIDKMEAGLKMDELVHTEIMEGELVDGYWFPEYSTDISAAWPVVEKMDCGFIQWDVGVFEVELTKECITGFASANTLPLAIYRAALKAVREV